MAVLLIGYARCSTDQQDLTAQRDGLIGLGVPANRIYVDHGLTGTNRERPGLREALAACRDGDTLVVTKLDRLARSLPDARAIADELTARHVRLSKALLSWWRRHVMTCESTVEPSPLGLPTRLIAGCSTGLMIAPGLTP
jgi:hypothetical protein